MKKVGISLILNMLIVILVTIGFTFMFIGFKFMPGDTLLETTRLEVFKFYTVDSNILIGIISLILVIYEIKLLNGYIDKIPNFIYILKLIGTAGITLTFATTAIFLVPQYGFYAMYNNSNLFFHLMVPILSIVSYIVYEKHDIAEMRGRRCRDKLLSGYAQTDQGTADHRSRGQGRSPDPADQTAEPAPCRRPCASHPWHHRHKTQ